MKSLSVNLRIAAAVLVCAVAASGFWSDSWAARRKQADDRPVAAQRVKVVNDTAGPSPVADDAPINPATPRDTAAQDSAASKAGHKGHHRGR